MKVDLKAIRARADAATKGPWGVWEDHAEIWAAIKENTPGQIVAEKGGGPLGRFEDDDDDDGNDSEQAIANAEFAAAARADVPALCDRVEALEAALREALPVLGEARGTHGEPCRGGCPTYENIGRAIGVARRALEGEP